MRHTTAAVLYAVLALGLAVFSGTAFAGGGNGNGNGGGPGNTGSAPGQAKQAAPPAAPPSKAQRRSAPATPTTNDNSTGVKPSNSTAHDTTAPASSNKTKQYGNGKTAGQIATKAGYGDKDLHGPGNSQPHKVACGPHEVDVHALKNKGDKCKPMQAAVAGAQKAEHVQKTEAKKAEAKQAEHKPCAPSVVIVQQSETSSSTQSAPAAAATGGDNSTGVKPSHSTDHDTTAAASSNKTKQYGNGKTAGQIATAAGFGGATLHGPGNSQPHKVLCGPHEVDVHALKAKAGKCSTAASTQAAVAGGTCEQPATVVSTSTQTAQATQTASATQSSAAAQSAQSAPAPATAASAPAKAESAGGVKGATATLTRAKPAARGGVLGATAKIGSTVASTRLPFTGLPLWIFVAVAAALVAIGFTVRRSARDQL